MKPKILLAGATGYIGKYLYEQLKDSAELTVLTKYPVQGEQPWSTGDIFSLEDVMEAMAGVDHAVYFLDPTKRSSRMNEADFKDLNALAADNYGRASEKNGLKSIVYIAGATEDDETIDILKAYRTPVQVTTSVIRRKGMMAKEQPSKTDDVRVMHRFTIPEQWTMKIFTRYYFSFFKHLIPGLSDVSIDEVVYRLQANNRDMVVLHRVTDIDDNSRQRFNIEAGRLVKKTAQGFLEFRRIKNSREIIVAIHEYEPALPWLVYQLFQSPFHHITMKVFYVDMRIECFNEQKRSGVTKTYTKD